MWNEIKLYLILLKSLLIQSCFSNLSKVVRRIPLAPKKLVALSEWISFGISLLEMDIVQAAVNP